MQGDDPVNQGFGARRASGHEHIYWFPKIGWRNMVTGTYINHNHFAGYLALATPLALGWLLEAIGVPPAAGRLFDRTEDGARLAVVSHGLWKGSFGGDPGLLGNPRDEVTSSHCLPLLLAPTTAYATSTSGFASR